MHGRHRGATLAAAGVLVAFLVAAPAAAERLAVRRYTSADGLAGDYVIHVVVDSRGFLWLSTRDGVSRFDGLRFTTYRVADGLPHTTANHVLETRDGTLWVATNGGGIARFEPKGTTRFTPVSIADDVAANRVNLLYEDRAGRLWAGTDNGLWVRDTAEAAFRRIDMPVGPNVALDGVNQIEEDAEGSIWTSGSAGVRRLLPDGRVVIYRLDPVASSDGTTAMRFESDGRLWVASVRGIMLSTPDPARTFGREPGPIERTIPHPGNAARDAGVRWFTRADGLPDDAVTALHASGDGRLWAGTMRGIAVFDGRRFRAFPATTGLPESPVSDMADDPAGNLWVATVSGVARLITDGLVTYDEADGLSDARVRAVYEDSARRLVVVTGDFDLNRFDGHRFHPVRPAMPAESACSWASPCGYIDRMGGWWLMSTLGLHYWKAPAAIESLDNRSPDLVLRGGGDLPSDYVFRAFEDSRGRVWIATSPDGLSIFDRQTRSTRILSEADGLPPERQLVSRPNAFAEDRAGGVWVGFEGGGLVRERDGRFTVMGPSDGMPAGRTSVTALHIDATGRLWIATSQSGVGRIDDPGASPVAIHWVTTKDGLTSDNVRAVVDGADGRLYLGTTAGMDRLDPATGAITHFTVSEGLASQFVTTMHRDAAGTLWIGTISGLSRLDPSGDMPARAPAPAVFISGLRLGGTPQPIDDLGEATPDALVLPANRNQLQIDYFAFNFQSGATVAYQYLLEGADTDWSPPTDVRTVNYARLAPGTYRFHVRAVRSDGVQSETPAVVAFRVSPPFYATWWFGAIVLAAVGALAAAGYRLRVAQLLRVERVRARIATDLHDDIGSSLSQIAILAEVARQRLARQDPADVVGEPLGRIAETSRTLVDSMSDIVWAINPEVDSLGDLVHRIRRFIEDTLGGGDLKVSFSAPDPVPDIRLGADVRREVLLILKESVTNVARHAGASSVTIGLSVDRRRLRLVVTDDGRGFDPDLATDGNGVASMRRRVAALGGRLAIESQPGRGTSIRLDVDLASPAGGNLPS